MKRTLQLAASAALILTLGCAALAGDIDIPKPTPPPPQNSTATIAKQDPVSTGTSAPATDSIAVAALDLLEHAILLF